MRMKKIVKVITVIAAASLALSCSEFTETVRTEAGNGPDELTAFTETASTRTTLSESDGKFEVFWSSNDAIEVVGKGEGGASKSAKFSIKSGSGTSAGTFSGTIADAGQGPYYAVFPYTGNATLGESGLHFLLSQNKGAQLNNIASKTVPAVAEVGLSGEDARVNMRNVCGLLGITVTSSPNVKIKKMTLHDLGGNMLWGDCTVPVKADGSLDYDNMKLENGTNTISMRWNTYVTFNSTVKTYYFTVPPGSLDRGFSVVFYELDLSEPDSLGRAYAFTQKVSSPVTAERSMVIRMDPVALSGNPEARDVKARGYYKSLFVDGGMYLSTYVKTSQLPAISYLGLDSDYEYFGSGNGAENQPFQNGVMVSAPTEGGVSWNDANGVLLYPDGEPRFRVFYSNGGTSYNHGPSLGDEGRQRVRNFYLNGGSYTGSCAGSFLASTYVDSRNRYDSGDGKDFTYGLWPGNLNHTHLPINLDYPSIFTGMKVLPALAELGYYPNSFRANDTLEDTRHHGGSYLPHDKYNKSYISKAVELMTFQYANKSVARDTCQYRPENLHRPMYIYKSKPVDIVDSVSTWAYKKSDKTGRLVVTGSHPEGCKTGRQRDYTAMIWRYAMDGNGDVSVKGDLQLGKTRTMDKTTEDNYAAFTRIGDKQYHHFRFTTAEDIPDFNIVLSSDYNADSGINLWLTLRKDDFAWLYDADYTLCQKGGQKVLRLKNLPAGTWYIGVYCATTVTATPTAALPYYFEYSGKTEVLDGIPYDITLLQGKTFTAVISSTRADGGNENGTYKFDD